MASKIYFVFMALLAVSSLVSSTMYERLTHVLLGLQDPEVIPVVSPDHPVHVTMSLNLFRVVEMNFERGELELYVWLDLEWNDPRLAWSPDTASGIENMRLPAKKVWRPDITLYNDAGTKYLPGKSEIVLVTSSGDVTWIPAVQTRSFCTPMVANSTGEFECTLTFGSWVYDNTLLNLDLDEPDLAELEESPKYELINMTSAKNIKSYPCCPESYTDVIYTLTIRERN